ncbi:MAG: TetR/AcrR family transcriptional regulator [Deltaproteobacteria bacterium]|nr:TetR/AcrR family transcriptional regulator [Deltaproteobacteria bacterium]
MKKPDRTRELLLDSAKRLFAQKGYDGTSVKELAADAGVNISLVSYHFKGKEGLYRTCLQQYGKQRLQASMRILTAPATKEELRLRLGLFVDEMISCHIEEPELSTIVHRECEQELPIIPDIFRETFLRMFETLIGFLKAAQRKKLFSKKIDAHLAAVFLFGSILHMFKTDAIGRKYFGLTIHEAKYRRRVRENIMKVFLDGVLA